MFACHQLHGKASRNKLRQSKNNLEIYISMKYRLEAVLKVMTCRSEQKQEIKSNKTAT